MDLISVRHGINCMPDQLYLRCQLSVLQGTLLMIVLLYLWGCHCSQVLMISQPARLIYSGLNLCHWSSNCKLSLSKPSVFNS